MSSSTVEPRDNERIAFAFPGVGITLCGREAPFYQDHLSTMEPYMAAASEACGMDLAAALEDATVETVADGEQQFFTYAYCAGLARVFKNRGVAPQAVAGFSFGIYAALHVAEAVGYEDGLTMLRRAYLLMEEESRGKGYGMGIVVGLEHEEITALLEERTFRTLCLVNSSNHTCHILSGTKVELEQLLQGALARDAYSAELLEVDIPYHHPRLLGDVSSRFEGFLRGLPWRDPVCPVVSSIDQVFLRSASALRVFAAQNLTTPINWHRVVEALQREGVTRIVECGPGLSLTQNGRFITPSISYTNIKKTGRWLAV